MAEEDFYVRYYVGHKGKFGHEFLEFEAVFAGPGAGKVRCLPEHERELRGPWRLCASGRKTRRQWNVVDLMCWTDRCVDAYKVLRAPVAASTVQPFGPR